MRRLIDSFASLMALVALAPLLAVVALVVKVTSRGPVIYRAERIGRGGAPFRMLKFRTMIVGADRLGPGITARDDPRVTKVGRLLRSTKLDELPQLLNVLRGDMALIGPRAESPQFVQYYSPRQRHLLTVRPGVTGPGQIFYTRNQEDQIPEIAAAEDVYVRQLLAVKLERDLQYLEEHNPLLDLKILLQTIGVMVAGLARGIWTPRRHPSATVGDPSKPPRK